MLRSRYANLIEHLNCDNWHMFFRCYNEYVRSTCYNSCTNTAISYKYFNKFCSWNDASKVTIATNLFDFIEWKYSILLNENKSILESQEHRHQLELWFQQQLHGWLEVNQYNWFELPVQLILVIHQEQILLNHLAPKSKVIFAFCIHLNAIKTRFVRKLNSLTTNKYCICFYF